MLMRLSFIKRGYYPSQLILLKYRPIHLTSSLAIKNHTVSLSSKRESINTSARSQLSVSEISKLVLQRLRFRQQHGVVKALMIGSGILIIIIITFLYVFRKPLKDQTVVQVADVAKNSLAQDSVKEQVSVLSQELIQNLLSDPNMLSKFLIFLENVMNNPSTKQTFNQLLHRMMTDQQMQQYISEFTSEISYDVMKRSETKIQLGQLFRYALLQEDNQDTLNTLLKDFVNDQRTKKILTDLALEVSHQVLNDENVKIAATAFVKDILNDAGLQRQSGDFAWNAFKNAFKPRWFTS